MPTLFKYRRAIDTETPESEQRSSEVHEIKLPELNLPEIEIPKIDVGKAVLGAATAVGLVERRRSRWPFLLGAGVVIAVAAWAFMNTAIRERLAGAVSTATERVRAMRAGGEDEDQEPRAFPAAQTAPIDLPSNLSVPPSPTPDYPEGFGAENETSTTESAANNGHETATAHR